MKSLTEIWVAGKVVNTTCKCRYFNTASVFRSTSSSVSSTSSVAHSVKLPLFNAGFNPKLRDGVALTDYTGRNFTHRELVGKAATLAHELKRIVGSESTRVSILCSNDSTFPIALWGTWMAGHTGVSLSEKHPENLLEYFVGSTESKVIVTIPEYADKVNRVAKAVNSEILVIDFEKLPQVNTDSLNELPNPSNIVNPAAYKDKDALILFTSGTTGKPKGVLLTHSNIEAQVSNMCNAWEFTSADTMLHTLPLHHTHGLIHALLSPLSVGARCLMLQKFEAPKLWAELLSNEEHRPSLFMGVPTVYVKLLEEYDKTIRNGPKSQIEFVKETCMQKMRLMLSGSASLPVPVLEQWEKITGHRILERYGMTEIGVALANPLRGVRKPGTVGRPFQSVKVCVADMTSRSNYKVLAEGGSNGTNIIDENSKSVTGDLLVKGPSVFKCYYNNPEATEKEFTDDGWFITGDTVEYGDGSYKILGRKSVDIIKSGGYKLSALEIETQLLSLDEIKEVAVMGLPDATWGQRVAALIVWNGKELSSLEFKELAKSRLAPYAVPTVIKTMDELARNHLGKVNKKELVKVFSTAK